MAAMLRAVRPVVVGLLLWTAYDMGRRCWGREGGVGGRVRPHWDAAALALVSFGILTFTAVNPIWVIMGAAAVGFAFYR